MKRIVILGSGFGGVNAYLELLRLCEGKKDIQVTLLSDVDYFWFVPMAHELAVGNVGPASLKQAIRTLPQIGTFDFVEGTVKKINLDSRTVFYSANHPADGEEVEREMTYDYLISALGAETCYFGVPGAAENTLALKSMQDARKVRNSIIHAFEEAQYVDDEEKKKEILTFVVIGGGPTGVELAGELADLIQRDVPRYFRDLNGLSSVVILQREEKLLPQMDEWFSKKVETLLRRKNVDLRLGHKVTEVRPDGVLCSDTFVPSQNVFWTAGVQAVQVPIEHGRDIAVDERSKRMQVTNSLNLSNYSEVYLVGDQAWICDKENKQAYPMRAQFAVRQGRVAAQNIVRDINGQATKEFYWKDLGFLVSLGHGKALAQIGPFKFDGRLAWFAYRVAYLPQFVGWRSRFKVMFDWVLNYFLPRDLSEI